MASTTTRRRNPRRNSTGGNESSPERVRGSSPLTPLPPKILEKSTSSKDANHHQTTGIVAPMRKKTPAKGKKSRAPQPSAKATNLKGGVQQGNPGIIRNGKSSQPQQPAHPSHNGVPKDPVATTSAPRVLRSVTLELTSPVKASTRATRRTNYIDVSDNESDPPQQSRRQVKAGTLKTPPPPKQAAPPTGKEKRSVGFG